MSTRSHAVYFLCLILGAPAIANAHSSALEHGFVSGLIHPFSGLDHLAILLAAGFWAQRLGGYARTLVPVTLGVLLGYAHAADGQLDAGLEWHSVGMLIASAILMGIGMLLEKAPRLRRKEHPAPLR